MRKPQFGAQLKPTCHIGAFSQHTALSRLDCRGRARIIVDVRPDPVGLPILLKQAAQLQGEAGGRDWRHRHGAGFELVVGDGGAFDGAADQKPVQPVGQVAAIEAVGPFAQIARQVLGADAMVGADEPGFDLAEQGMDDRKEDGSIALSCWTNGVCFKYSPRSASRPR